MTNFAPAMQVLECKEKGFSLRSEKDFFKLPAPEGEPILHVLALRPNKHKIHNLTFGVFSVNIFVWPSWYSSPSKRAARGGFAFPQIQTVLLAKNQAKYIRDYCETRTKRVKRRWEPHEQKWTDQAEVKFSDIIICCTPTEYQERGFSMNFDPAQDERGLIREENIQEDLIEAQENKARVKKRDRK